MRPSPGVTLLQYFLMSEAQVFSSFAIFAVSFSTIVLPGLVCADADATDKMTSKGKTPSLASKCVLIFMIVL
jgi:hypothetical protein